MRCISSPLRQGLAKHLSLKKDEKSCYLGNETMDKRLTESSFLFVNRCLLCRWWEFIQWDCTLKVNLM